MQARFAWVVLVCSLGACTSVGASRGDSGGVDARAGGDARAGLDARAPGDARGDGEAPDARRARHFVLRGGYVVGTGVADVEIDDGRIVAVGVVPAGRGEDVDVGGRWIAPAAIDSHVHLAYLPVADELASGGIAAAVDLAAPMSFLADLPEAPRVVAAGPMITAVGGYPTRSWGAGGYGLEVAGESEAAAAVDRLHAAGARIIKVPVTSEPALTDAELRAVTARAHALGLLVAAHALEDRHALRAADAGCDLLAHTPVEPLSEATIAAWSGRAVVSTLEAFGASSPAIDNLRRLRAAGATVLYGTDLGNTRTPRIDRREVLDLLAAGLAPEEVLASMTSAPARLFHLDDLGAIAPGAEASLLVLGADPLADPTTLCEPVAVYIAGSRR